MTIEHKPPQLSADGALLLAEVLASRRERDVQAHEDAARDESPRADKRSSSAMMLVPGGVIAAAVVAAFVLAFGLVTTSPVIEVDVAGVVEEAPFVNGDFMVSLERVPPPNVGVQLLDVSVAAGSENVPVGTDRFTITVHDPSSGALTTIVHFVESELRADGTATAMIRAEGAQSSGLELVVQLDGVVIERLAIN